jgi:hypothetical protein
MRLPFARASHLLHTFHRATSRRQKVIWINLLKKKTVMPGLTLMIFLIGNNRAPANQNYSEQVFFENSLSSENYFYSSGTVSPPSTLELIDGKLPVETDAFISGPECPQTAMGVCRQRRLVRGSETIPVA